jgi:hypothetical protein
VLDALATAIETAQGEVAPAPAAADSADALRAQTDDLRTRTAAARTSVSDVTTAIAAVQASRCDALKAALTTAIGQAQQTYADGAGGGDPTALATLQSQIVQARDALAALPTDNGDAAATIVAQWKDILMSSAADIAVPVPCGTGSFPPSGIDAGLVCGGMPSGAVSVPSTDGSQTFALPSNNIGCTGGAEGVGVICEINSHSWAVPDDLHAACLATDPSGAKCSNADIGMLSGQDVQVAHDGTGPWLSLRQAGTPVTTLPYNKTADFGQIACQSSTAGVTCWDVTTHHGFRMATQSLVTW